MPDHAVTTNVADYAIRWPIPILNVDTTVPEIFYYRARSTSNQMLLILFQVYDAAVKTGIVDYFNQNRLARKKALQNR